MTVEAVPRRVALQGDGEVLLFNVPFNFFEINVYINKTLQIEGTDYTINQEEVGSNGSVEFTVAPADGTTVTIAGATRLVQPADFVDNDPFAAETMENVLDRLVMAAQELREAYSLNPQFPGEEGEIVAATSPDAFVIVVYGGRSYQIPANLFLAAGNDPTGIGRGHNVGDVVYHALAEVPLGWIRLYRDRQMVAKADFPEWDKKCAAESYPFGSTVTHVGVPGVGDGFFRAWDNVNASDPDRTSRTAADGTATVVGNVIGSRQASQIKSHTHGPGNLKGTAKSAGTHRHNVPISPSGENQGSGSTSAARSGSAQTSDAGAHTHDVDVLTGATTATGGNETRPGNVALPAIMLIRPGDAAGNHSTLGVPFTFSTETVDADPTDGFIRLDNADPALATFVYISKRQAFGASIMALFQGYDINTSALRGYLTIYNAGQLGNSAIYTVTGSLIEETEYFKLPVSHVSGSGSFLDNTPISLAPFFSGPEGIQGADGAPGADGASTIIVDEVVPDNTVGSDGDLFIDGLTGQLWKKIGGEWTDQGYAVKGPPGPQGPAAFPDRAVRVATTANITIATALNAGGAIDGVTLANGNLVLVKDQTAAEENGVYVVGASPARDDDYDTFDEHAGVVIAVMEGTQQDTLWQCTSDKGGVLGSAAITFVQLAPDATASKKGIVQLASQAEAEAQSNQVKAVTPEGLANFLKKNAEDQGPITGGASITPKDVGAGSSVGTSTVTIDPRDRFLQFFTTNGTVTFGTMAHEGCCVVWLTMSTTGGSPGAPVTTGWTVDGDGFTLTNGHVFRIYMERVGARHYMNVRAMQ